MMATGLSSDALARAVAALPDDALREARQIALRRFNEHGFPSPRHEDWKYTDLSNVVEISRLALDSAAGAAHRDDALVRVVQQRIDADWLVITNGEFDQEHSLATDTAGVEVLALDADTALSKLDEPLADLNLALLKQGLVLRVNADRLTERPIGLLIADTAESAALSSQVRIDIEMLPGSAARFLEYHVSSGKAQHYSNTRIDLQIRDGARAEYLRFQDRALNHSQTARLNVRLDRDSTIRHCGIDLGGHLTRNDLRIDIAAKGAAAAFDGLYIAADGQHVDNHTRIDHRFGPATSEQEYRGVLSGRCRAVWNGKAIVHKGADGTDAQQANHNLLLSEHAEIDAKPELEIYADEVKCAHGTTVGQLDEKALFYLRSRGLDKERAKRVLTRAFAASIVNKAPLPELHEMIGDKVEHRLRELAPGVTE